MSDDLGDLSRAADDAARASREFRDAVRQLADVVAAGDASLATLDDLSEHDVG
jgi:ABC-type transporter Mla subunit MlaD